MLSGYPNYEHDKPQKMPQTKNADFENRISGLFCFESHNNDLQKQIQVIAGIDMRNSTYIEERKYNGAMKLGNNPTLKYWKNILGEEVYEKLNESNKLDLLLSTNCYTENTNIEETEIWRYLISKKYRTYELVAQEELNTEGLFTEFYVPFIKVSEMILIEKNRTNRYFEKNMVVILRDFEQNAYLKLHDCSVRMLIFEMHLYKEKGHLQGENPQKEYEYFAMNILKDETEYFEILYAYPALVRLLIDILNNMIAFYGEVLWNYRNDASNISRAFGEQNELFADFSVGNSDSHSNGKSVVTISFGNGKRIIYKPHSIKNECVYQTFLSWVSKKTGYDTKEYEILDFKDHGWAEYVVYQPCDSEDELKEYYERIGLIIFCNYLLNVYDMHNENIISCGPFPIVIDAETILRNEERYDKKNISDVLLNRTKNAVLTQGLLPRHIVKKNSNKSIDISGVSNEVGQEFPVKVPVIINAGSSSMRCIYKNPIETQKDNIPYGKDSSKKADYYIDYILTGFEKAYQCALDNLQEFYKKYEMFESISLRHLRRDTQTYAMILNTSKHPDFLIDCLSRQLLLSSLYKDRDLSSKIECQLIDDEIQQLLRNDIPIYYYDSEGKDLCSGYGLRIKDYFENTALDVAKQKLCKLNKEDLEQQKLYIILSFSSTENIIDNMQYKDRENQESDEAFLYVPNTELDLSLLRRRNDEIIERLLRQAHYNEDNTKIGWIGVTLHGGDEAKWNVVPLNYDIYNGIGGIAIFFHAYSMTFPGSKKVSNACRLLDNSLFEYKNNVIEYARKMDLDGVGGYFTGEISLINTFVLLFQITNKKSYLNHAIELCDNVIGHVEKYINRDGEIENDIISGIAGVVIVLLKLYDETKESKYINLAINAGDALIKNKKLGECGYGWTLPGDRKILGGLSHGISGIAYALLRLWSVSRYQRFLNCAENSIEEENSLYVESKCNWADRRMFKGVPVDEMGNSPIKWCHGAGGILMARMQMYLYLEDGNLKRVVEKDILRASHTLINNYKTDNMCLCHGMIGNLEILYEYAKFACDERILKEINGALQNALSMSESHWNCGLIHQSEHYGFMLGISGIGYFLLRQINESLPCVLALE